MHFTPAHCFEQATRLSQMETSLFSAQTFYASTDASSFSTDQCQRMDQVFMVFAQGAGDAIATLQSAVQQGAASAALHSAGNLDAAKHYQGICACLLAHLQALSELAKSMQARRASALASLSSPVLSSFIGKAHALVQQQAPAGANGTQLASLALPGTDVASESNEAPPATADNGFTRRAANFVDKLASQDGTKHVFSAMKGAVGTLGGVLGGLRPDAVAQRDLQQHGASMSCSRDSESTVQTEHRTDKTISESAPGTGGIPGGPDLAEKSVLHSSPVQGGAAPARDPPPKLITGQGDTATHIPSTGRPSGASVAEAQAQLQAAAPQQQQSSSAEAEAILRRMQEVSSLVALFASKVQEQAETIDAVVTHTEQATADVEEGGKQLQEALQGEGTFRWAVFWLLVAAGLLLLAMDYFS